MNVINSLVTKVFDLVLAPLELMGKEISLILISGIFGILALIAFKHISYQKGIKAAKDKIKAHLIAIRLYQNDLVTVTKSIGKILARNFQYILLNFGPFIPLAIPFVFVLAQLVVRYAFVPVPLTPDPTALVAGQGTTIQIELAEGRERDVASLVVEYPDGLTPISPLVRVPSEGRAFQEVVATASGEYDITFRLGQGAEATKRLIAGDADVRWMQPERVKSAFLAALWPVEHTFAADTGFEHIHFKYPESDLGWLPGSGLGGVLIWFLVASMAFGVAVLKPLGIQI